MKLAKPLLLLQMCFFCPLLSFAQNASRTIEVHARRYAFDPAELSVKQGESVRLKLYSDDVPHSLLIKELGVDQTVSKGHPIELTITPRQTGDFHGQCGRFCGSGHGRMLFTIHVTGN